MFAVCFIIKDIEFLFIKTDSTFIGENIICKIVCIIATVITAHKLGYKLSDIGFGNKSVIKYAICGLGLGIVTFAVSYGIEMMILAALGANPRLSVYITNFGLTGATNEISLSFSAVVICIVGNIVNVLAEEGLFRGIILKTVSDIWGLLTSIKSISGEPVCLWLPEHLRKPVTNEYVQGVEVEEDYTGTVPEGFDVIDLPKATYLLFRGEPFEEENFETAIAEIWNAEKKYDPAFIGYEWDEMNPRIQLEPVGTRGYIELVPVKKK